MINDIFKNYDSDLKNYNITLKNVEKLSKKVNISNKKIKKLKNDIVLNFYTMQNVRNDKTLDDKTRNEKINDAIYFKTVLNDELKTEQKSLAAYNNELHFQQSVLKMYKTRIAHFSKRYLTFRANDVVKEFENVCKKFGNSEPEIDIDLSAEIVHGVREPNFKVELSADDCIDYFNKRPNNSDCFVYFNVKSNKNDKKQFEFVDTKKFDFNLTFSDESKLSDNFYPNLIHEKNNIFGETVDEFFTQLHLKDSAKPNLLITLDGTNAYIENKIVKNVYNNLFNKALKKQTKLEKNTSQKNFTK